MLARPSSGFAHPARVAALVYGGVSVAGSAAFLLITTFTSDYPAVARYGGAAWVFLLLMIVLMPLVIPRVQRRGKKLQTAGTEPTAPEDEPVSCSIDEAMACSIEPKAPPEDTTD